MAPHYDSGRAPVKNELVAPRVMWLLNHSTLREFEMRQLQALGVREIFLPKTFPHDESNLSASVDSSYDAALSLPPDELRVLNSADWYREPSHEAWEIANHHFDVLFFAFFPQQIENVSAHFRGDAILRVFGHARGLTYSGLLYQYVGVPGVDRIRRMGDRFWFGAAYAHLPEIEHDFIRRRACYLPLGLRDANVRDEWSGDDRRLYFVCPRIGCSNHFRSVYDAFKSDFAGIDYVIGGAQPVAVKDSRVIGYVPAAAHRENMRRFRVMYYHSTEPNHVHYHPFEAIRIGMPMVYLAGGLLDRLAGERLPGCCRSAREARHKIERILRDDDALIDDIRRSQVRLLEPLRPERCEPFWREGFGGLLARRAARATISKPLVSLAARIAIIVPSFNRPAELTYAKRIALALGEGAIAAGESAQIVIAVASEAHEDVGREIGALPSNVSVRTFRWKRVTRETAEIAFGFCGHQVQLPFAEYIVADDGINHLLDCRLWIVTSDELSFPLLPLRPYCMAVFGYPQRYLPVFQPDADLTYRLAAQQASRVWTPSAAIADDAAQYAGVSPERIRVLRPPPSRENDAVVTTKSARKIAVIFDGLPEYRQVRMIEALKAYYAHYHGLLPCLAIGRGPSAVVVGGYSLASVVVQSLENDRRLRTRVEWDPFSARERSSRYADVAGMLFAGHADGPMCYLADALCAEIPVIALDSPSLREMRRDYPDLIQLLTDDDAMAIAAAMHSLERRACRTPTGAMTVGCDDGYHQLAIQYWTAVREVI